MLSAPIPLLVVGLSVVTCGLLLSRLLAGLRRPYLFSVTGTRPHLLAARAGIWLAVAAGSSLLWAALGALMPGTIALALFFGVEAVALDICSARIGYVELAPARQEARPGS
ncbi:MAG: hypothetical protein IRY97_01345 [Thermomicrobiaceae bacterium]|nr:hypothetical protein [Thermomicrobiaceae bacterium]